MKRKLKSSIILGSIVIYGIFKIPILRIYSAFINRFINTSEITDSLNFISSASRFREEISGWLIYYPTYVGLHLVFIAILFHDRKKTRNILSIGLVSVIIVLLVLIIFSRYFEFIILYKISYESFQNLIGLPFILLFIEGGRILYNDIISLQHKELKK